MQKKLPGTTVTVDMGRPDVADTVLSPLFLTGGLMLSQVSALTGLEPHTIQNWVKRGFLTSPDKKKYSRRQLCRILIINMMRDSLQIDRICSLLSYINGHLNDESDDLIDDSQLYGYITALISQLDVRRMTGQDDLDVLCDHVLQGYQEPYDGAGNRVKLVLRIIITAYMASAFKQEADSLLSQLESAQ